jgi:hypothetical protein
MCVAVSDYDMKVSLRKVFSLGHRKLMCCTLKFTIEGEKVKGGEHVDARRNTNRIIPLLLYVAAMKMNCVCM